MDLMAAGLKREWKILQKFHPKKRNRFVNRMKLSWKWWWISHDSRRISRKMHHKKIESRRLGVILFRMEMEEWEDWSCSGSVCVMVMCRSSSLMNSRCIITTDCTTGPESRDICWIPVSRHKITSNCCLINSGSNIKIKQQKKGQSAIEQTVLSLFELVSSNY